MGVEKGVATRMAQKVRPMMIVTATNFEGSIMGFWAIFTNISKLLPSEALRVTIIIGHTI